jgi:hypothetical protein
VHQFVKGETIVLRRYSREKSSPGEEDMGLSSRPYREDVLGIAHPDGLAISSGPAKAVVISGFDGWKGLSATLWRGV